MGKSNPTPYLVSKEQYARRFNCSYSNCNKFYTRNSSLQAHITLKHNETPEDESEVESEPEVIDYSDEELDEDFEENDSEVINDIDTIMNEYQDRSEFVGCDWEENISEGNPFKNPQTMIMMCLFSGHANPMSRSQLKTLLYAVDKIVGLAVEATENGQSFRMPSANMIMKASENKGFDGPTINTSTTKHTVTVKGKTQVSECSAILPSEHLKLSMANPKQCQYVSALPDRTQNVSKGLTTGDKWTKHPKFQPPQMNVHGLDFWVGDVANLRGSDQKFLIRSFFCQNGVDLVDGYYMMENSANYGIISELISVPQQLLMDVVDKNVFSMTNCCTLSADAEDIQVLSDEHKKLLFVQNKSKVPKNDIPGEYIKAIIDPIIFFTDDSAGTVHLFLNRFFLENGHFQVLV